MRDTTKAGFRIAALLCVAALTLAACGGSSSHAAASSPTSTTPTTGGGQFGTRLAAFRTCMAAHGVTLPQRRRTTNGSTPGTGGGGGGFFGGGGGGGGGLGARFSQPPAGVDPTKYQNALNACRSQLPTGGNFNSSAFQAYRSCLQDHGVTLPAQGSGTGLNRNDPKVQSAMATCRPLLPAGAGRNTSTTTAS